MRKWIGWTVMALALGARAGVTVSELTVAQRPGTKLVDISYSVQSDEADVVEVALAVLQGATIVATPSTTGNVGAGVPVGAGRAMVWDMGSDWNGRFGDLEFTVIADDGTDLYLVIDLSGGASAVSYGVSYLGAVPPGGWTDEHRTSKLVLRRILGGTFAMGSPLDELGRTSYDPGQLQADESQHVVQLSRYFYIGVFEVTQRQWELVMGTKPSYFVNAAHYATRPVEQVSYHDIRGNPGNTPVSPGWPASDAVHPDSFVGRLRTRTGLATLDLPTEAQWEYACRAGSTTSLNSGDNISGINSCPVLSTLGRYWNNGGSGGDQFGNTTSGSARVGSYQPNAWGLYDMHGNVWEWCLDWYGTFATDVAADPQGPASGLSRVARGGGWNRSAHACRSAHRYAADAILRSSGGGFRIVRKLP